MKYIVEIKTKKLKTNSWKEQGLPSSGTGQNKIFNSWTEQIPSHFMNEAVRLSISWNEKITAYLTKGAAWLTISWTEQLHKRSVIYMYTQQS